MAPILFKPQCYSRTMKQVDQYGSLCDHCYLMVDSNSVTRVFADLSWVSSDVISSWWRFMSVSRVSISTTCFLKDSTRARASPSLSRACPSSICNCLTFSSLFSIDVLASNHCKSRCRHDTEKLFALLALCEGILPPPVDFPHKGPVMPSLDIFFIVCPTSCWTNSYVAGNLRHPTCGIKVI